MTTQPQIRLNNGPLCALQIVSLYIVLYYQGLSHPTI